MKIEDTKAISWLAAIDPTHGLALDERSLRSLVAMAKALEELIASGRIRFED